MSQNNRFVDSLFICGLNTQVGLEPNPLLKDHNASAPPLERFYQSSVLAHFPESHEAVNGNAVNMLCMPRGLQFRVCPKDKAEEWPDGETTTFHPFIITSENGSQIHGYSLTCWEQVQDPGILNAMVSLQTMHVAETSPKFPFLTSQQHQSSTHSLPRHFRVKASELSHSPSPLTTAFFHFDPDRHWLLASKCIVLVCTLPLVHSARALLQNVYKTLHSSLYSSHVTVHDVTTTMYYLLYHIPLPSPNHALLYKPGPSVLQRPAIHLGELPLCDYPLRELFTLFRTEAVLQLLTSILLEHQILLYSKECYRLMLVGECLSALLWPFSWPHVYVPILPAAMRHFLDAPVPYVMGLHVLSGTCSSSQPSNPMEGAESQANACVVDIDNGVIEFPEDLPPFPHQHEVLEELQEILKMYQITSAQPSQPQTKHRRKMSWNSESERWLNEMNDNQVMNDWATNQSNKTILEQSPVFQRVAAIAQRTGVITSLHDWEKPNPKKATPQCVDPLKQYETDMKLNNALREIIFHRFLHLFAAYEHFLIQPSQQDADSFAVSHFDSAPFLSDQPRQTLAFLARFLDTQLFTNFIDAKIMALQSGAGPGLRDSPVAFFDLRLKQLRDQLGESTRTPGYEPCKCFYDTENLLIQRLAKATPSALPERVAPPLELEKKDRDPRAWFLTRFTLPDANLLNQIPAATLNRGKKKSSSAGKKKEKMLERSASGPEVTEQKLEQLIPSAAAIAQTNWKFVEQLLKECKAKTKRLLVDKMGSEAVELGHGHVTLVGLEENPLLASLCDLLERIWSHGLQQKQGKSALWSHLLHYQELENRGNPQLLSSQSQSPNLSTLTLESDPVSPLASPLQSPSHRKSREREREPRQELKLRPLPVSVTFDMRNVQSMSEIKTEVGLARAWVRLALEKKLLSTHLRTLLSKEKLLRTLYKRYAFLRCEDEREQFLFHLLSLNAVDYHCYTNTYTSTVIPYHVVVVCSKKVAASVMSSSPYVAVSGTLGESGIIHFSKSKMEFLFQHKNLGLLTTLRIGHDNTGLNPRWLVDFVLVRNGVTGQTYRFPCGRWLGRGVDDGSSERLLVAEATELGASSSFEMLSPSSAGHSYSSSSLPRARSPSVGPVGSFSDLRSFNESGGTKAKLTVPEIQQILGDSVNTLVKYFHRPSNERGSLTPLLCGEGGLVSCVELVLSYGFRSSRFFGRNLYLWDYFIKVKESIEGGECPKGKADIARWISETVNRVEQDASSLGKDGKFQLLVCLGFRSKYLHQWCRLLPSLHVTYSMFEESSFLRDPQLCIFLEQILATLSDFSIVLEASITRGISL